MSLKFGLIGAGLGGALLGGALMQQPGGAELVAVATCHELSAKRAANLWGAKRWYSDWHDLLADPEVDAVCIATPTGTHAEIAIAAAHAGKHVLTEKPMATTLTEADAMIETCAKAGVTLGVIFMYRFMETAQKMKEAIDGGLLGRVILGECSVKFWRDQAYYDSAAWRGTWWGEGGGSLMTQASHTIDLLVWMLGDVESLAGFWATSPCHQIEVDDLAVASIRFRNGALGTLISSTAIHPPEERVLAIHGERGTITLVGDHIKCCYIDGESNLSRLMIDAELQVERGDTVSRAGYADPELHRRQIEDFVNAILNHRAPAVDGYEGRRTLEVMRALYLSNEHHQVISFPIVEDGSR